MSRYRKSKKPLFKKKRTPAQNAWRAVLIILLVAVLVFLGYSIGKPVVEFFDNLGSSDTYENPDPSETLPTDDTPETLPTSTTPEEVTATPTTAEPETVRAGIYFVSFAEGEDITAKLADAVKEASAGGYKGVCLELVAEGGRVNFLTANETAVDSEAVAVNAPELAYCAELIENAGLLPYARVSALSDHIASWYDRSICYLFEDGSSKWLDNSLSNGGKPWISPFSENAKAYISSFIAEISDAGFAGVVAGEFEFPPFRTKDLGYVGKTVQDPERYKALCEFSNTLSDTLGSAKFYAVEVDALDILTGECEVLRDPALLNANTVYVKYSSADIGTRVEKADGSAVSFEGLSEEYKLAQVYRLVNTELSQSGLKLLAAVDSPLDAQSIYTALESIGYTKDDVIIY